MEPSLLDCLENRALADNRVDPTLLGFAHVDGRALSFEAADSGHFLCYDTLHQMREYPIVSGEFSRVPCGEGCSIFIESDVRHSSPPEVIALVELQKRYDPAWVERGVVLDEIDQIARAAGSTDGLSVVPMVHLLALQKCSMDGWGRFRVVRRGGPVKAYLPTPYHKLLRKSCFFMLISLGDRLRLLAAIRALGRKFLCVVGFRRVPDVFLGGSLNYCSTARIKPIIGRLLI